MLRRELMGLLYFGSLLLTCGCGPSLEPPPEAEVKQRESAHEQLSAEERQKYKGGPKRAHGG
ncbi:MAG: hypothetical protein B7Z55_02280 [Planctomycetales bacterium 12-60-4]|nr:MAG: hypothetical protein B7Z55_02280 [Planctomycetales bacterium 12-60-4]